MKKLKELDFFSNNLVKKRNFFVNLLILSSLCFVFFKNIEKIRYSQITSEEGKIYIYDRFASKLRPIK
ncbi:MAG: hypothetical protein CMP36_02755 [Rickettsiales bacterium]|nr:hypothetical protein [Rickettsiales bacterium]OUV79605.1 MAG: hypothetical protein CBC91_03440 [Rickettsiales bacterium TMED131]